MRRMAQAPPFHSQDPYAADNALSEWATARGFAFERSPDLRAYQSFGPFSYLSIGRVGRELRASLGDASAWLVEVFDSDPIKQAAAEDRGVCAFITSPRLAGRAALRSKQGGGLVNDVTSGLGSLFKGSAGGLLGDPTLESHFDVSVQSREDGFRALPMPLRQLLVQSGFRGVLEIRPGALVCSTYELKTFEPAGLDRTLPFIARLYQAATS
jgi:hypothetical protein